MKVYVSFLCHNDFYKIIIFKLSFYLNESYDFFFKIIGYQICSAVNDINDDQFNYSLPIIWIILCFDTH
jgi:hypothetical protein